MSAFKQHDIRVPGDGSEHIAYIRANIDRIPDFLHGELAYVVALAEAGLEAQKRIEALEAVLKRIASFGTPSYGPSDESVIAKKALEPARAAQRPSTAAGPV